MKSIVVLCLVLVSVTAAFSADIVTVPTANQLKAGEADIAYYYLRLDNDDPVVPANVHIQTVYVGLTDRIELDIHRYDPEKDLDKTATIYNASVLLMEETAEMPAVVVGVRNIGETETTNNTAVDSGKRSWYLSAAKNITPMLPGGPQLPLIRVHASIGTKDYTLLGEDRHGGLFGGVQALLTPEIGAVALYDGADLITGLTYTPGNTGLTIKGGTFGDNWWAGLSYAKSL